MNKTKGLKMKYLTVEQIEAKVGLLNTMLWDHVKSELRELVEAIQSRNIHNVIEETCDVITTATVAIRNTFRVSIPVIWKSSAYKWMSRMDEWRHLFQQHNLVFDGQYLINGGNPERTNKRGMALIVACKHQQRNDLIPHLIEHYELNGAVFNDYKGNTITC